MTIKTFCKLYNIDEDRFYAAKSTGVIPKNVFYRPVLASYDEVDNVYFVKRKELQKKIQLINQDMYYFLTETVNVMDICDEVQAIYGVSIKQYLYDHLFRLDYKSIINTKVSKVAWIFYKYGVRVLMQLRADEQYKIYIAEILDKRMV